MFPEKKFALVKFKPGIVTIEEGKLINDAYKNDSNYSKIEYLLVLLNDCIPNFSEKELQQISNFYNNEFQPNNHICTIWVVDAPILTAYAHMFVNMITENSNYCSTIEKAYSLLGIPIPFYTFEYLISSSIRENE